jgi:hypothetical protein
MDTKDISNRINSESKYLVFDKTKHPNNQFVIVEYECNNVQEYVNMLWGVMSLKEVLSHILIKRYDAAIIMTDTDEGWMICKGPFNTFVLMTPLDDVHLCANLYDTIEYMLMCLEDNEDVYE